MKKTFLTIALFAISLIAKSQTADLFFEQTNEFMKKNVTTEGKVDYRILKKSPGELFYILDNIVNLDVKFSDKKVAKAFWINVYNLQVIKNIIANYPLKSVNDIPNFFDDLKFKVGGQELSLNDIENIILRDLYFDAAVHFSLSSGANGGSPLLNEAYSPDKVEDQLKERAKLVINSKDYFRINREAKTIELSKIFEWYKKDFAVNYFNEIDFINLFLERKIDNKLTIKTYNFDWTLNQK
jgi:hypothetical protein